MTRYVIYRADVNDPFGMPRGWLKHDHKQDAWVPSDWLTKNDTYSKEEAEAIAHDWNEYFASKGYDCRAHVEEMEGPL